MIFYLKQSFVIILFMFVGISLKGKDTIDKNDYGKPHLANGKYRILIDKVNMTEELKDESFKHAADLGFNMMAPRYGATDPSRAAIAAARSHKYGMYYLGWLRGSFTCNDKKDCYTLETGFSFNIYSPCSDEYWEKMTHQVMNLVKLNSKHPVYGTFLDFELYARPLPKKWPGHCYSYSYDENYFNLFCERNSLKPVNLKPGERKRFLEEHKILDKYQSSQLELWTTKLRELRNKIDAIHPNFMFFIYPSSYTLFVNKAVWNNTLGTKRAPLVACEYYTYVRGFPNKDKDREYWRISNEKGVALNVSFLRQKKNIIRRMSPENPFKVLGGIDPITRGGECPMFQAMSAVAMAKASDGYWIFYEGVTPRSPQDKSFDLWLNLANKAIENGTYDLKIK